MINYLKYASKNIESKKYPPKAPKKLEICVYMQNKISKLVLF